MGKKMMYGLGSLGYSVIGQTISNFFMFFATSVLGIRGTIIGAIIAISTIWDCVSESIIEYLSDNFKIGKLGKRQGYMLIATFGMTIFNLVLWCIPLEMAVWVKVVWILLSLILLETFNTMFATPYNALGNEMASSYNDRTKINATSTVFYLLGIIIPSILLVVFLPSTEEYPIGQLNPNGYVNIAIVTSIIALICGLLSSISAVSHKTPGEENREKKFKFKEVFGGLWKSFKNKKLRTLIWGYVMVSMSTVFLCSVGLHFFTYSFFYTSNQITILLLSLITGTIISQPLWVVISNKKRKKPALIIGIIVTILSVFGIIGVYLFRIQLYSISFYLMIGLLLGCGVGSGSIYSLPSSLYGDAIEVVTRGNDSKTATYGGALTFASNIANSATQLLTGVLLDIIKFDSSLEVQSLGVQTGLALIVFIGVQASLIIGCLIFAGYKEKGEKFDNSCKISSL